MNHTEVTEKNDNIKIRLVVYLISLFIMTLGSVGIGTVIAALLVGMILGVVTKFFGEKRDRLLRLC